VNIWINGLWLLAFSKLTPGEQKSIEAQVQIDYGNAMITVARMLQESAFTTGIFQDSIQFGGFANIGDMVKITYEQIRLNRLAETKVDALEYRFLVIERNLYAR
jgi:hypothetical protein